VETLCGAGWHGGSGVEDGVARESTTSSRMVAAPDSDRNGWRRMREGDLGAAGVVTQYASASSAALVGVTKTDETV
jgi:hypothetical protein